MQPEGRDLSFAELAGAVARPGIYLNLLPYLVLIPFVVGLNLLALRLDDRALLAPEARAVLFVVFTSAGVAVLWWTYGHLGILGDGSPSPHLGGTRHLVTTGPYAVVRHPSVLAKLLGVLGTGFLFGSPLFLGVMLPLLLAASLAYNRTMQEAACVRQFGEEYLAYRRRVPFLVPRAGPLLTALRVQGTAEWFTAWLLLTVLLLQALQLWWLRAGRERYVWVPLQLSAEGELQVPAEPLVDGPAVLGPTLTIEDVVRGLLVMEEHPEKGLALDPAQRRALAPLLEAAARERDEMLRLADQRRQAEAEQAALTARVLQSLTPDQRRALQSLTPEHRRALQETAP